MVCRSLIFLQRRNNAIVVNTLAVEMASGVLEKLHESSFFEVFLFQLHFVKNIQIQIVFLRFKVVFTIIRLQIDFKEISRFDIFTIFY